MTIISFAWWWTHRNRYWIIETKTTGVVKSRIVHLPLQHIKHEKLRREVKIFNRLCLVLPTVNGVAVIYREQMRSLLRNPKYKPSNNPYERLFYGYACYVLMQKNIDEVFQRQLKRNLLFLFAPSRKIVKRRLVVWSRRQYELHSTPIYKIFKDNYLDPTQPGIVLPTPCRTETYGSYLKYYNNEIIVRRYAHAYTLDSKDLQTITLKVAHDKTDFDCQINRGIITCKHLSTKETHTYAVRGEQVRLATSMCSHVDALEIYITWQGHCEIRLDGGHPRWLTLQEIETNQHIEHLVTSAYQSKYITGERLRSRYLSAEKLVPSLSGSSKVIAVRTADDFRQVWVDLTCYRKIASLFQGFSLVLLYSGATTEVTDLMMTTLTNDVITSCHQNQLWLYLIDRTVTETDALYIFNKMANSHHYVPPAPTPTGLTVTKNWPYVKTLTVTNTLSKSMTRDLVIPLQFNQLSVVSANGTVLTVVGLSSGRVNTYVLPVSLHLTGEWITTHVNIPLKVKLAGYES
ncbi:MAG: hypothetical protein MJ054_02405, partial [Clostridia bacterium]|nr:hypothetical protein [Clostridia bacterium]